MNARPRNPVQPLSLAERARPADADWMGVREQDAIVFVINKKEAHVKYGCQCECSKKFSRGTKTRKQYANEKIEHAATCRKMWDWLRRSGKEIKDLPCKPAAT
jgi:hypothetical protein